MTDVPFSPTGAGVRIAAGLASNSAVSIGGTTSGGGYIRIVNLSAVAAFVAVGASTVDATNNDFAMLASSTAILGVGPAVTHVNVQPVSGSNNVFIVQRGQIG